MQNEHELNQLPKILFDILKPYLGPAANKIVPLIIEKIKHERAQRGTNVQENRIVAYNGFTMFAPSHPIKTNEALSPHVTFKESHKLGRAKEVANQPYNNYQAQAALHKQEREAGARQREEQQRDEHNNNEVKPRHFFYFKK